MPANQRPDLKVAGDGVAADAVHHLLLTEASRLGINLQLSAGFEEHDLPELIADVDVMYAMYVMLCDSFRRCVMVWDLMRCVAVRCNATRWRQRCNATRRGDESILHRIALITVHSIAPHSAAYCIA